MFTSIHCWCGGGASFSIPSQAPCCPVWEGAPTVSLYPCMSVCVRFLCRASLYPPGRPSCGGGVTLALGPSFGGTSPLPTVTPYPMTHSCMCLSLFSLNSEPWGGGTQVHLYAEKNVSHLVLGMACAGYGCTDKGRGGGGSGALAFRPTPGCLTIVCTSGNSISPIAGAAPHSLHLGKGLGTLRHDNILNNTRRMCGGAQCFVAAR